MREAIDITDALLAELRGMIVAARGHVARVANAILTMLFWRIGQRIHRDILREKRAVNGKQIVAALGRHLTIEFGAEHRMTPDLARTLATITSRRHQVSQTRLEAKKRETG